MTIFCRFISKILSLLRGPTMDSGYEEFASIKFAKDPGADTNLAILFRFYFMLGFIVASYSKLEVTLEKVLMVVCGMDSKYQHEIAANITFSSKIEALVNICEINTLRFKGDAVGK